MTLQSKERIVASLRTSAVNIDRAVFRDLIHTLPDLAEWNIDRCRNMPFGIFILFPNINDICSGFHQIPYLIHAHLTERTLEQIARDQPRMVAGIFCC